MEERLSSNDCHKTKAINAKKTKNCLFFDFVSYDKIIEKAK